MRHLYLGTYPDGGPAGSGEGIWSLGFDQEARVFTEPRLLVATPAPTFVAQHPTQPRVYAVSETSPGTVSAFAVTPDGLDPRGSVDVRGADPCHVVALRDALWVCSYSSGTFSALPLDEHGDLRDEVVAFDHDGSGPVEERQEGPHAHSALATPCGRFVWVMDLGTDEVRRYRRSDGSAARLVPDGTAAVLPAGAGPRHAAVHESGTVFVAGELDSRVHVLSTDRSSGSGVVVASSPACATPGPDGSAGFPSHVALSADGTRLYVAVRGPDVLSTFAVHDGARLEHLGDASVGGAWPRHFAVLDDGRDGDVVVVANQGSSDVTAVHVDARGRGRVVASVAVPVPSCVLPA
ncbi:lactonase family protein [Sanguibacter suaedae]|uniref:Lactonase family protein n=1 Tax=Sanguibacter suaedae TaxID=2795737 RepID=A0A934ICN1_9MICO|nr:beta-propeller fold lactonase family protein [Sanguibacter suaedae]MBI9116225.1 lactonase family protein [Sanguibacter suaedae]